MFLRVSETIYTTKASLYAFVGKFCENWENVPDEYKMLFIFTFNFPIARKDEHRLYIK